jgi:alanine racemase
LGWYDKNALRDAAARSTLAGAAEGRNVMQRQTIAEINLVALGWNYRAFARCAGGRGVIAVVKANAYGPGAVEVSRRLAAEGAETFAVVTLSEAAELRAAGIGQEILVLGVVDPARVAEAAGQNVTITLHGAEHAAACAGAARRAGVRLKCHLKVDTDMRRWGEPLETAGELLAKLRGESQVEVRGLITHLARADEEDFGPTEEQLGRLRAALGELERRGLRPPLVHVMASAAALRCGANCFDAVRPGLGLYGLSPGPALAPAWKLRPVMEVRTVVALVKNVAAGEGVSYGHTWRAARASRLGVLPIGYADGYPRSLSNRGTVRVAGRLAPVVGRVSMDAIQVDITDIPEVQVGTAVTVLEAAEESPLSAAALAELTGTISYEILTGIGQRVRRVYVEHD